MAFTIPRRRLPADSRRKLRSALIELQKRMGNVSKVVEHNRKETGGINPPIKPIRRHDELFRAVAGVQSALHTGRYRNGFKALAKLQRRERDRERHRKKEKKQEGN